MDTFTQFEIAKAYQTHESFRLVVAETFSASKTGNGTPSGVKPVETMQELMAAFSGIGGQLG